MASDLYRLSAFLGIALCLLFLTLFLSGNTSAGASDKKNLTVRAAQNISVSDLIASAGYTLEAKDLEPFLKEFVELNRHVKSLSVIPKGTVVRLPARYLTRTGPGIETRGVHEAREAKREPRVARPDKESEKVLRNLTSLLDDLGDVASVTSGGVKVFSVSGKSELSFDTSAFPLVELKDKTVLMLDYRGILPHEIKDVIEIAWPEYRIVTNRGMKDLKGSVGVLLDSMGYSFVRDGKVFLGDRAKIEFRPDFVVMKKRDGEMVAVTIVNPDEYRVPEGFKEWARGQGIRVVELSMSEHPRTPKKPTVITMAGGETRSGAETLLKILGYAYATDRTLKLSDRREFQISLKTDIVVSNGKTTKVIQFTEVPEQIVHYAGKRGFDILDVAGEERLTAFKRIIRFLSADLTERPEVIASRITPEKAKYRLSAPGALVTAKQRTFFLTDAVAEEDFFTPLVDERITVVKF